VGTPDRRYSELSELLAEAEPHGLATIAAAIAAVGMDEPLADAGQLEDARPDEGRAHLLAPVRPVEVWAAGLTYRRSRDARASGSATAEPSVYDRAYDSSRLELFFKATGPRVLGPGAAMGLREDGAVHAPEPELVLVLGSDGAIVGYTLGNDQGSRDIELDNPLYLPQAKIYAGSCAMGPVVVSADELTDPRAVEIECRVLRDRTVAFEGATTTANLRLAPEEIVTALARANWLPPGAALFTGTGIAPGPDFTLRPGDVVEVTSPAIGTLRNPVLPAAELPAPHGWWTLPGVPA
jgi:2-dehydro-3-deoxy-D-arabinonate dehydratase